MSRARLLFHMVRADFLERVRRYSFLLTLGFSALFVYAIYSGEISLRLEHYHGVPNSAWLGAVIALVGSVFLSLGGFYVVKNTIQRDRETRVGRILAATPMSPTFYTIGKVFSNFAVLSAMVFVLALGAFLIQLLHKQAYPIHCLELLAPLAIFTLSALSVTAAVAVLFETLPGLRGGFGNVAYFFLWCFLLSLGVRTLSTGETVRTKAVMTDFTGIGNIAGQMQAEVRRFDPQYKGGAAFTMAPPEGTGTTFVWNGMQWDSAIILGRALWVGLALFLTLLAAACFDRFDPAREFPAFRRHRRPVPSRPKELEESPLSMEAQFAGFEIRAFPRSITRTRFLALVIAEFRLLIRGRKWWWYLVAAGLFVSCLLSPLTTPGSWAITLAWFWPVLIWSQLGTREAQFRTGALIFSAPRAFPRQLLSSWIAGVLLALVTGGGTGLHLLFAPDLNGLVTWMAAALFIPALALALGVMTLSRKPFEALYTVWWYLGPLHHSRNLDFIGTSPASSTPLLYLIACAFLLLIACGWRRLRLSQT